MSESSRSVKEFEPQRPRLFALAYRLLGSATEAEDVAEGTEWVTGDLRTCAGLERAVRGVAAIIHCATDVRAPRRDVGGTRNLVGAAAAAAARRTWSTSRSSAWTASRCPTTG